MSDVEEIKSRLNIVDIVGEHVTLKKAGRNLKGLCPFHSEKTPSFIVSPDRQTFHCFGCGKGGDVVTFYMEYNHLEFREALEDLAERTGIELSHSMAESPEQKTKDKILQANQLAYEYYQYILLNHKIGENARLYLKNRGVSDKSVKTFGIGYSPNSWDSVSKFLTGKGFDLSLLKQAGLIGTSSRGTSYDMFRGRLMFALKDHRGKIIGFSGRLLDPEAKEAKYINTAETPVYSKSKALFGLDVTKQEIQKSDEVIVMEGEFDVISSFQKGIGNCVAIKGSALTEQQVSLLHRYTENIIFALDSDYAGDAAQRRGIEIADRAGFNMKVAILPFGKDPDEAVRENEAEVKKAFKKAVPIYDFFILSALKRFDPSTAQGKKLISNELLPIFLSVDNLIVQSHYLKKLAEKLDVEQEILIASGKKMRRENSTLGLKDISPKKEEPHALSRTEKLETYLLALILQGDSRRLFTKLQSEFPVVQFQYMPVRRILESLETYFASHEQFDMKEYSPLMPPELSSVFDEAYLQDLSTFIEDTDLTYRVWEKAIREIKLLSLRKQHEDIRSALSNPELPEEKRDEYQKQLNEIIKNRALLEKAG